DVFGVGENIDSELLNHSFGHRAVGRGTFNRERPAVTQQHAAGSGEFIAFSMSSEVVVVFEDKNSRFRPCGFAEKVGGREAADASPHDDQVVYFAGID